MYRENAVIFLPQCGVAKCFSDSFSCVRSRAEVLRDESQQVKTTLVLPEFSFNKEDLVNE